MNNYKDISLEKFFDTFKQVSLFGMKINYLLTNFSEENNTMSNKLLNIGYSLTLSSLEISFNNKEIILKIIDYLISINKCSNQLKVKI